MPPMRRYAWLIAVMAGLGSAMAAADELPVPQSPAEQYALGLRLFKGIEETPDPVAAERWFLLAAEQGHAGAQLYLGHLYSLGGSVPQDYARALLWFTAAAEQGDSTAQFNLGNMYAGGIGVRQDLAEAYKWFLLAAERDQAGAAQKRDMLTAVMTAEQIASAQARARQWESAR